MANKKKIIKVGTVFKGKTLKLCNVVFLSKRKKNTNRSRDGQLGVAPGGGWGLEFVTLSRAML